jgi:antirestriction protein
MSNTPRVYAACLSSYNNGILYGQWIDCDQSAEGIQLEIKDMLAGSRAPDAEEWAFHDYEGFGSLSISESEDVDNLSEWARLMEEYGAVYFAYVDYVGKEYATEEDFQDRYCGECETERDYAEQFLDDIGDLKSIPEHLQSYFDYEQYAHELFINDVYSIENPNGGFFVFTR